MKATGIIRRIDDLGRVVIPKEIRRKLRLNESDPLEIYVDKDTILLKKYETSEERLRDECRLAVEKFSPIIKAVAFMNDVTTVVLKDGRTGSSKYNSLNSFDLNVAIVYALKEIGIDVGIEELP